jgi:hypothetical protein
LTANGDKAEGKGMVGATVRIDAFALTAGPEEVEKRVLAVHRDIEKVVANGLHSFTTVLN